MVHYRPKNKFCLQELGRALSLFKRRETYTRRNFYTRNLFTKTFLTERNFYFFVFTERRFCTQRFLHRETFTSTMAAGNLHPQNRISVRKTKNDFKTFFSHVTKDFKKGKSSAPMEKKKTYSCSHARYYCGTLTRPFHCDLHLFFRAVFFCWSPSDGLIWGACGLGNLTVPPSTSSGQPRRVWRARSNGSLGDRVAGHGTHLPGARDRSLLPTPSSTSRRSHQQQWLLLRPGNRCGGVNAMVQHFPERTARSALDSLKCIELPPNEQLILNVFNHSSGDVFFLTILEGNHSRLSRVV